MRLSSSTFANLEMLPHPRPRIIVAALLAPSQPSHPAPVVDWPIAIADACEPMKRVNEVVDHLRRINRFKQPKQTADCR
jgi:hypothetical protein